MNHKWTYVVALLVSLISSTVVAEGLRECLEAPYEFGAIMIECKMSKASIDKMEDYFLANPNVNYLFFYNVTMENEVAEELFNRLVLNNRIKMLNIVSCDFDPSYINKLANKPSLNTLLIYDNNASNEVLLNLASNHSIENLYLGEAKISLDTVFEFLDKHPLSSLGLQGYKIPSPDMNEMVYHHAQFRHLTLADVSVESLEPLKNLEQLEGLQLEYLNISDTEAGAIATLSKLKYLGLYNSPISVSGAKQFNQLQNLEVIYFQSNVSGLGDEGIKFIKELPKLKSVYLLNQDISEIGAQYISQNSHLTDVELAMNHIGDEGAIALSKNPGIKVLDLRSNNIGDVGAIALANSSSIETLFLDVNKISDLGGIAFSNRPNLKYLHLGWNRLTDVTAYAFAKQTTPLDYLGLYENELSKEAVDALRSNINIKQVGY
jgi:hypothetical protein